MPLTLAVVQTPEGETHVHRPGCRDLKSARYPGDFPLEVEVVVLTARTGTHVHYYTDDVEDVARQVNDCLNEWWRTSPDEGPQDHQVRVFPCIHKLADQEEA